MKTTRYNRSVIFSRMHEIRRNNENITKSAALRMAWAEAKTIKEVKKMELVPDTRLSDEQIAALENIGFNRWTKYGKDRLYITYKAIGLELDFYKTGNISCAYLDGEKISNCYANKLRNQINNSYIDVNTSKICGGIEFTARERMLNAIAKLEY